jgi:1-aminocyclopropane-1-carboxylate deaminase/D-cysteine desulfhydrase-like pyridoxal-dependent ACC family enzyme
MKYQIDTSASQLMRLSVIKGVEVWVKRDDLIDPMISGNKWRKLKGYLQDFAQNKATDILSFGGAYSNHLAALAAAGQKFNINTHALVRGEAGSNPTLDFCRSRGMKVEAISRTQYRAKDTPEFLEELNNWLPDLYLIPEGGKGPLGMLGCREIPNELAEPESFDYWLLSGGTGTTAAGLILNERVKKVELYSALKGGQFLRKAIAEQIWNFTDHFKMPKPDANLLVKKLKLEEEFHFGGYAKVTPELVAFMNNFYREFQLKLDPVYTGKLFYGLWQKLQAGYYPSGSRLLVLHTGGLQGIKGMNQYLAKKGWGKIDYEA